MKTLRHYWVVLAGLGVLAGAYLLIGHVVLGGRLADARSQIARAKARIAQDQAAADRIPQLQQDVERLRRQLNDFDHRLPAQQELGEFLKEISNTAQAQRLESRGIQPGISTRDKLFSRLPITLGFNGGFADVVGFLEKLDGLTRLTRIERIEIRPTENEGQALQVDMQINIYFTES